MNADRFRPVLEQLLTATHRLQDASGSLVETNQALGQIAEAISGAVALTIDARGEHEDLRETVHRLELLVLEQSQQIREQGQQLRELRERLNGGATKEQAH